MVKTRGSYIPHPSLPLAGLRASDCVCGVVSLLLLPEGGRGTHGAVRPSGTRETHLGQVHSWQAKDPLRHTSRVIF